MLDECMPPKASRLFAGMLQLNKPPIEAVILQEYLGQKGALDCDWAKLLQEEGGWYVITADNGKAKGAKAKLKGPPLHLILPARGITGFYLAGKMSQRSGFEKIRAVIYTLPDLLLRAGLAPPGTRYKIKPSGHGYSVSEWPLTSALPPHLLTPTASPPPSSRSPPASSASASPPGPSPP